MKLRTIGRALFGMLLVACLWNTSSTAAPILSYCSPVATAKTSNSTEQSLGQRNFIVEKKVAIVLEITTLPYTKHAEKNIPSGFFLSSAITQYFINTTII
jgi:hypothetical protein